MYLSANEPFEIFSSIGMKIIKQSALLITETIDMNFFLKFCSLYVTCATTDVVTVRTLEPLTRHVWVHFFFDD